MPFQKGLHKVANLLQWSVNLFRSKALTPDEVRDELLEEETEAKDSVEQTPQRSSKIAQLNGQMKELSAKLAITTGQDERTELVGEINAVLAELTTLASTPAPEQTVTTKQFFSSEKAKKKKVEPLKVPAGIIMASKSFSEGTIFFDGEGVEETSQESFDVRVYFWKWIVKCLNGTRAEVCIDVVPLYDITGLVLRVFELIPNIEKKLRKTAKDEYELAITRKKGVPLVNFLILLRKKLVQVKDYKVVLDKDLEKTRLWNQVVEMELGSYHRDLMKIQWEEDTGETDYSMIELVDKMMKWALRHETGLPEQGNVKGS